MTIVSLTGMVPPARYDSTAWTHVQVQEASAAAGPWVTIDTQPLSPLDSDPTAPAPRSVTTSAATLTVGWYRLVFTDAAANVSPPSFVVRHSSTGELILPPTAEDLRAQSPLLRQKFPVPATDPFQTADLYRLAARAVALVSASTWRIIDPDLPDPAPEGYVAEPVPAELVPVAFEAVQRMAERLDVTEEPDFAEQVATGRRLRGFSAGPYSESYFAPGEFARRGVTGRPPMDQDDMLDAALWALATEDARDYFVWRETGVAPPTAAVTTFDYRRQNIGYTAGGFQLPYRGGSPDGW